MNFGYCKYGIIIIFFNSNLMAVHTACTKKKIFEVNNFRYFFKTRLFHFDVFQVELASLQESHIPATQKAKKSKFSSCPEPRLLPTNFSKLVNLCLVKKISPIPLGISDYEIKKLFRISCFSKFQKPMRKKKKSQINSAKWDEFLPNSYKQNR